MNFCFDHYLIGIIKKQKNARVQESTTNKATKWGPENFKGGGVSNTKLSN